MERYEQTMYNKNFGLLTEKKEFETIRKRIKGGVMRGFYEKLSECAQIFMTYPVDPYVFGARSTVVYEKMEQFLPIAGRTLCQQAITLAVKGLIDQEEQYTDKARRMILSAAQQADVQQDIASWNGALSIGDMAHTFCIAYDLLYDIFDETEKALLLERISQLGEWIYERSFTQFWGDDEVGRYAHNWNTVTHSNLGLCGILTENQAWIDRALERTKLYFKESKDKTGVSYEGFTYMCYGLNGAIAFAIAYERYFGVDLIGQYDSMKQIGTALAWHIFPDKKELVALNQASGYAEPAWSIWYLINRFDDEVGLWGFLQLFCGEGGTYGQSSWAGACASVAYSLLFYNETLKPKPPWMEGEPCSKLFERGQVVIRDNFLEQSNFITFTCGKGIENIWNHCDTGSVTLRGAGADFLLDPGAGFGGSRYHNTVLIDGAGMGEQGGPQCHPGVISCYQDNGTEVSVLGDMTKAYRKENPVKYARRLVQYQRTQPPVLQIYDRVRKDDGIHRYTENFITRKEYTVDVQDGRCVIRAGGAQCCMLVRSEAKVEIKTHCDEQFRWIQVESSGVELERQIIFLILEEEKSVTMEQECVMIEGKRALSFERMGTHEE